MTKVGDFARDWSRRNPFGKDNACAKIGQTFVLKSKMNKKVLRIVDKLCLNTKKFQGLNLFLI